MEDLIMKNIHVLPTDKPSRLHFFYEVALTITSEYKNSVCDTEVNIYITSDDKIKEGDWFYASDRNTIHKNQWKSDIKYEFPFYYKIILTTDQDLIKDGVQPIDDKFLEWFVKNPSCESVEVQKWASLAECGYSYHITIPQEEFKQETLEEAAERLYPLSAIPRKLFIKGAEWQQEQDKNKYSEEDMIEFAVWLFLEVGSNKGKERTNKELFNKWFEQFKKK